MDEWISVNWNAPTHGIVHGEAEIRNASDGLIDALYTALLNHLPFPLPMSNALVTITNIDIKNVDETDYLDVTTFGATKPVIYQSAPKYRRDITVAFY